MSMVDWGKPTQSKGRDNTGRSRQTTRASPSSRSPASFKSSLRPTLLIQNPHSTDTLDFDGRIPLPFVSLPFSSKGHDSGSVHQSYNQSASTPPSGWRPAGEAFAQSQSHYSADAGFCGGANQQSTSNCQETRRCSSGKSSFFPKFRHSAQRVSFASGCQPQSETVHAATEYPSACQDYKKTTQTAACSANTNCNNTTQSAKMGYYDADGHFHSFRHGIGQFAQRAVHSRRRCDYNDAGVDAMSSSSSCSPCSSTKTTRAYVPNTVTIPCEHIRVGDFLMLQGRPCRVIRISTSAATGQHCYLGVDLFNKTMHEETSFVTNPAPSTVVQTMLGPVLKQYRVLDMRDGCIVAMTDSGNVKQNLPVIDQSNLWEQLNEAFTCGRGGVRALIVEDEGRELAVGMKKVHASCL
ncbi:hypothetical protein HIM_06154 [Hirsutella minnesotensis 3608]|uniref:Translation initiation factor 5A-like N-terminal domain-containing protein n=1 Tax=Hirsutella minnesotensis 3608 TaxID=1043627 RepID=A0A0F7ZUB2_9HYPO|nr:hypothetical protein HIM_06154 [Hirsutella minnesotensis 3608]